MLYKTCTLNLTIVLFLGKQEFEERIFGRKRHE